MTEEPQYRLRDLRVSRGSGFTLQVGQLDLSAGEVLGLLGPTGSGKTTLLRLLAGQERPHEGEVWFENTLLRAPPPLGLRRRITLVHQHPILLTGSVQLNIEYGLWLRRDRSRTRKVGELLERLGLAKVAGQSAQTLSGGQSQLVALARALVIEPDVLLLDEPTAHLDPAHVALVEQTVHEYRQQRYVTVVWATHNLFQARRTTDRAALLLNGQLVEVASTSEFFLAPADPRTADFVQGRMVY